MTPLTLHAGIRCQQRCITRRAVDLVFDYGEWRANHDATSTVGMTREGRDRILADHGPDLLRSLGRSLDILLVIARDGTSITVMWRQVVFQRDRAPPWERRAHCERRRSRNSFR